MSIEAMLSFGSVKLKIYYILSICLAKYKQSDKHRRRIKICSYFTVMLSSSSSSTDLMTSKSLQFVQVVKTAYISRVLDGGPPLHQGEGREVADNIVIEATPEMQM